MVFINELFILQGKIPETEASTILRILVNTVAFLHDNGVVHRDLKPANILFASEDLAPESVTICDMGFAKQVRSFLNEMKDSSDWIIFS